MWKRLGSILFFFFATSTVFNVFCVSVVFFMAGTTMRVVGGETVRVCHGEEFGHGEG